jgi:predicted nucleic acid-binding protein
MRLLIDSNRYRDLCAGAPEVLRLIQRAQEIRLPVVVLGELRAGFACGTRGRENERVLLRFLNSPRVQVLYADDTTTQHYANLLRQLRTQGTPIPSNDLWVAALAVQHGLTLLSRDEHFAHLPQLQIV